MFTTPSTYESMKACIGHTIAAFVFVYIEMPVFRRDFVGVSYILGGDSISNILLNIQHHLHTFA